MRIFKPLALVILCSLFLTSCSEPKAYHYKVFGTVIDENGNPMEGVEVILSGFDLDRIDEKEAVTDKNGKFVINFDIDPFEWRQEAHWSFLLTKDGYCKRSVGYPEFSFDDRFRYQGYWYKVFFRKPVIMKREKQL